MTKAASSTNPGILWKERFYYLHYNCFFLSVDTDKEENEPVLPPAQPLQTLFNKRAAFSAGEDISGRYKRFDFSDLNKIYAQQHTCSRKGTHARMLLYTLMHTHASTYGDLVKL